MLINHMLKNTMVHVLMVVMLTFLVTASLIYLTPLKNITVIEPSIDDIDPVEFHKDFSENEDRYLFVDVRGESSYNRIHAVGSELMPLHTLYDERHLLPKNKEKTIVFICSGGVASGVAYHYLEHHGFFNLKRIKGGIEAWQLAGLPVEIGI